MQTVRMLRHGRKRSGYTLLEVLLASGIGALLLGGLYVAVDIQLSQAQLGRELIEESTLTRALIGRIHRDIAACVAPPVPAPASSGGVAGGATAAVQTGTGATAAPAVITATATALQEPGAAASSVRIGIQGTSQQVIVIASKLPRIDPRSQSEAVGGDRAAASDLRMITYWLAGGGESPAGLARFENQRVTSMDDLDVGGLTGVDESPYILAEEVRSLRFQYFDGSSWLDSWDGTEPGADGSTPKGPPAAVAVELGIAPPRLGVRPGQETIRVYRHVIPIATANGLPLQSATSP